MNLTKYNSIKEKELRKTLEKLSKDAEALKRAEAKAESEELKEKIKHKLSQTRKEMEKIVAIFYSKGSSENFYETFTIESGEERHTYRYFLLSKAIKSGRRKAMRGQVQQSSESEM